MPIVAARRRQQNAYYDLSCQKAKSSQIPECDRGRGALKVAWSICSRRRSLRTSFQVVTVNVKMDPRLRGDDDTPSMNVDDLGAGAHTPHDGWCDPNGLLWGFRRKAVELGAVYVKDRVVAAEISAALAT